MDPTTIQLIASVVGGLCCCGFWLAVIGGVVWFLMNRGEEGPETTTPTLEDKPDLAGPAASSEPAEPAVATPGPGEEVDPADAATVQARSPAATADESDTEGGADTPKPKAKPPKPPPRTSGATIIAFDDDFEDEED